MNTEKQIKGLTRYKRDIVEKVCSLVAAEFSIYEDDLFKKSRACQYSIPRSVAAALLHKNYGIQQQIIADYFGYVSHSSVPHAVRSLDRKINTDPEMRFIIKNILKSVSREIEPHKIL
jgi:chromosomal replication initiation ATPase DnaA